MAAGGSQAVQAVRSALDAVWAAKQRDRRAARHRAGCRGERAVCAELSKLAVHGFQHLDDRRWRQDPENRVNLDHLVVGPAGVFVVDAKNWAGRIEVSGNTLAHNGQACEDRLLALTWLVHRVEEVLIAAGHVVRPHALVCFASAQPSLPPALGRTLLTDVDRVVPLLSARPTVLSPTEMEQITGLLSYAFPFYDVDPQEVAEAEGLLFGDDQTRHAGMQAALNRPLEQWMVWLHPEQATSVRRSFAGPARIRGAAGTGKTCVALHRVAWLASTRPGRFLVTSYVRTLPPSLRALYSGLSPSSAGRVDFLHLHGVACEVLAARGPTVLPTRGDAAFAAAWLAHRGELERSGLSVQYFREEVMSVVKGRAVPDLQTYLALDRVGRRTPLRAEVRSQVWALKERYDDELSRRGEHDLVDVLRLARDEVRRQSFDRWAGVVVDEVQDLPLVGLQLLHELAGRDRPDGLLLVGDGQQAIYPGGFRLIDAGIALNGRAVVLRTNYRNTVEILATARAVVAADAYDDLDVVVDQGERDVEVVRHGELPSVGIYPSVREHDGALLWDLQVLGGRGVDWAEVAVLCQTNDEARGYARLLAAAGVPTALLSSRTAASSDAVQVGTWFRAKGMEFAHVFLPQVDRPTVLLTGAGEPAQQEKAELLRRTLYVAMTRARDTLWVGRVGTCDDGQAPGEPEGRGPT